MAGNLKNRRAESALGTVNTDLSRTTPQTDPQFIADATTEEEKVENPSGMTITGKSPNAKITAKPQALSSTLPGYPKGGRPSWTAPERKRT
jgi:hypothetical protein